MEKHPSTRPVLADDIEGIRKAGKEAREQEFRDMVTLGAADYYNTLASIDLSTQEGLALFGESMRKYDAARELLIRKYSEVMRMLK